ncbi:MAG: methyltransferase [Methanotrichaceae archaeon]|nr:methyltransferase [Methanotrichaceae archaeon]
MKRKQLEMMLERLEGFSRPSFQREQYATPASVAAQMLFLAAMRGELGTVCDLGCGTGMLAIGAALLGAKAIGVEIDGEALAVARRNAEKLNVDVDFIRADVHSLALRGIDTVVMNPPFGAQKASIGDRAFLSKALKIAKTIYSLHNQGSEGFIRSFVSPCSVQEIYHMPFPLKRCFEFHSQDVKVIEVELYRITCQ